MQFVTSIVMAIMIPVAMCLSTVTRVTIESTTHNTEFNLVTITIVASTLP